MSVTIFVLIPLPLSRQKMEASTLFWHVFHRLKYEFSTFFALAPVIHKTFIGKSPGWEMTFDYFFVSFPLSCFGDFLAPS